MTKMAMGCTLAGAVVSAVDFRHAGEWPTPTRISFLWLVGSTFIYTLGEMYLSPIGLSLVVKIAPPRMVSMLMGVWYLSIFFGNYMAGTWERITRKCRTRRSFLCCWRSQ